MHKRTSTLHQYMRIVTQQPLWRSWHVRVVLLACIVVVWGIVAFRIAQPRPHALVLPDTRETIAMPFVESFTAPYQHAAACNDCLE